MRAGYLGGLAAWAAFTLPSAIALVLFAYGATRPQGEIGSGLCTVSSWWPSQSSPRRCGAWRVRYVPIGSALRSRVVAALIILLSSSSIAQIGAIVLGAIAGLWLCRAPASTLRAIPAHSVPVSRRTGLARACRVLPAPRRPAHSQELRRTPKPSPCSRRSIAPVPSSSAADTWCCRYLREATVAHGWVTRRCVSRGLWGRAGRARTAVHFRGLSRGGHGPTSARPSGRRHQLVGIFVPGVLILVGTCRSGRRFGDAQEPRRRCAA